MFTVQFRRVTGIGLLVLGLAACSGTPTASPTTGPSSGGSAEPTPSPLDEYLGGARSDADKEADRALELQVQQQVAECMQKAGFEYTPIDPETAQGGMVMFDGAEQRDPEWVSRYGYGISTMDMQAPESADDPNNTRVEAMAESERNAYFEALYGNGMGTMSVAGGGVAIQAAPPVAAGGGGVAAPETSGPPEEPIPGCLQEAEVAVRGERPVFDPEQFNDLFEAMNEMNESIDSDPRLTAAISAWSDCMADAGHPDLDEVSAAQDVIFQRWADLNGWQVDGNSSGGGFAVTAQAVGGAGEAPALDPVELEKLKNDEIAMAQTDLGCRGEYDTLRTTVKVELETAFVQAHRAELEQFRDSMVR